MCVGSALRRTNPAIRLRAHSALRRDLAEARRRREAGSHRALGTTDADLRLVQSRAPALRTLARFRQLLFVEGESAGTTTGGDDEDLVAGGPGRTERVTQIVRDVTALQAKLPREPGHRPWLAGQQRHQIRPKHQRILQRQEGRPKIPAPTNRFRTSATRSDLPIALRSRFKP
jgi:hypothetical protein